MQVAVRLTYTEPSPSRPTARARPESPTPRPKAKVNLSARPHSRTPRALSPTFQPKVRPTVPKSTPATPQTRPRAPTSDIGRLRPRQSSATLHHAASVSSLPAASAPPSPDPSDVEPVRIKSKVSSPAFYPITTAVPAANPHRYTTRANYYQPFRPADPTPSPPASALSLSSRSSVRSTESSVPDDDRLDILLSHDDDRDIDTDDDDTHSHISAHNVQAEAKSNRKIADLEITNRSLLAINAALETAKHRQQKEIRDLRRKLRESRLILPPRTFRAVSSSSPSLSDNDDDASDPSSSDDDDGDENDEPYARVKAILETLLDTGRRALESEPKDFMEGGPKGGAKVLSADEVRSYTGEDHEVLDPIHIAVPDSDPDADVSPTTSEDEVEMTLTHDTPSPPPRRAS
ncbi:hypothetical protein H0H87_012384 [Tephrocybe sp. NHM501043]|nr:hypothetical protein H0H87_012384 [Tephrocybe sp. NHM501043]